jgi:hypothetical protein
MKWVEHCAATEGMVGAEAVRSMGAGATAGGDEVGRGLRDEAAVREVSLVSAGLEVGASQAEAPGPIASSIGMATERVD